MRRTRFKTLILSDRAFRGIRPDASGPAVAEILVQGLDAVEAERLILPDERERIVEVLLRWSASKECPLIVTSGGTGLGPRDVTPEATLDVIEKRLPGFEELMRSKSLGQTPKAVLSRGVCGSRGETLILNLPGHPRAVAACLSAVLPVLPHALAQLSGALDHEEAAAGP